MAPVLDALHHHNTVGGEGVAHQPPHTACQPPLPVTAAVGVADGGAPARHGRPRPKSREREGESGRAPSAGASLPEGG